VSEDQRTAQQWTVKVDGTELKKLGSGESVEIGRKPLRPLADDGFARLDIMDTNKSMSKRHAIVSVDAQGNASVRDLKSTNGSFVVADNGQLMRLPADEDFKLPSTPMTLQFGDVRVTFERDSVSAMPESESTTSAPVSNLFSYAVSDEASQEPDAADMSVDDILNLRAGEPTALFNARNVANRVNLMQRSERQSFAPVRSNEPDYGDLPSVSLVQHNDVVDNAPRDLFADAAAEADAVAEQQAAEEEAKKNAAEKEKPAMLPESQYSAQDQASRLSWHCRITATRLNNKRKKRTSSAMKLQNNPVPIRFNRKKRCNGPTTSVSGRITRSSHRL